MFNIIEDCSPFFIRFTHVGFENIILECLDYSNQKEFVKGFTHHVLDLELSKKILKQCPISNFIELNEKRVSLFITNPGHYYRAHKDGINCRFSINYTVKILDELCETRWYDDDDLKHYPIDNLKQIEYYREKDPFTFKNGVSREAVGFIKENHVPLKSMVAKPNEVILFNTDIFHDFDNSSSTNQRIVLTLRARKPSNIYFDDIKKIILSMVS
jgi:hypothetical protein